MTQEARVRFWVIGLAVFFLSLYFLSDILLPFVAGMAIAYFFDPVCDRLEKLGLSRTLATVAVTALFVVVFLIFLGLVVPAAVEQLFALASTLPALVDLMKEKVNAFAMTLDPEQMERLKMAVSSKLGDVAKFAADAVGGLLSGGLIVLNLVSLLVLTPVVAFFLLRDWDKMVAKIDGWLPQEYAQVIRRLARETDDTLSEYVRGLAIVCLVLGTFYAVSLSLVGLKSGMVIGMIAGLLTVIPYVGSIVGLLLAVGMALIQFESLVDVAIVAAIFFAGQAAEGNFLTPKLVGERVGLHPVIAIFALLAGGALFGFTGVLLAMPVAAVAGVLSRYALEQYLVSPLYQSPARSSPKGVNDKSESE